MVLGLSCSVVSGSLVPRRGIEPSSSIARQSLNHWTTREVPRFKLIIISSSIFAFLNYFINFPIYTGHLSMR